MKRSIYERMYRAGFRKINFCFGSASDRIQRHMNLGFKANTVKRNLHHAHSAGINTHLNCFVGFPGENEDDYYDTLQFFKENQNKIDNVRIHPCPLRPGSELERTPERFGVHIQPNMPLDHWHDGGINNLSYRKKKTKEAILFLKSIDVLVDEKMMSLQSPTISTEDIGTVQRIQCKLNHHRPADILLATLPPWGYSNPPLSLAFLAEYLKSKGLRPVVRDYNIQFYNNVKKNLGVLWHVENKNYWSNPETYPAIQYGLEQEIQKCVDDILTTNSTAIGFSVVDPKERLTLEIIRRIRNYDLQRIIFLGGPACATPEYRKIFEDAPNGWIHGYFSGEGEQSLEKMIRAINEQNQMIDMEGFIFPKTDTESVNISFVSDLEAIPPITFDDFHLENYSGESLLFQWSRGCIGKCSFCKGRLLEGPYRHRKVDVILEEIKYALDQHGISQFTICDSVLNGNPVFLEKVCDEIISKGLKMSWGGQILPLSAMTPKQRFP